MSYRSPAITHSDAGLAAAKKHEAAACLGDRVDEERRQEGDIQGVLFYLTTASAGYSLSAVFLLLTTSERKILHLSTHRQTDGQAQAAVGQSSCKTSDQALLWLS